MISATEKQLEKRAKAWQRAVRAGEVKAERSAVGGGSLPGQTMPTHVLATKPETGADEFSAALRRHSPPVIGRIQDDEVLLDPRTVLTDEDEHVTAALASALEAER
jgi:L-seryl-tRNA(Ser) seleniumtransferase